MSKNKKINNKNSFSRIKTVFNKKKTQAKNSVKRFKGKKNSPISDNNVLKRSKKGLDLKKIFNFFKMLIILFLSLFVFGLFKGCSGIGGSCDGLGLIDLNMTVPEWLKDWFNGILGIFELHYKDEDKIDPDLESGSIPDSEESIDSEESTDSETPGYDDVYNYVVRFYLETISTDNLYFTAVTNEDGQLTSFPEEPTISGKNFLCWQTYVDNALVDVTDIDITYEESTVYVAKFDVEPDYSGNVVTFILVGENPYFIAETDKDGRLTSFPSEDLGDGYYVSYWRIKTLDGSYVPVANIDKIYKEDVTYYANIGYPNMIEGYAINFYLEKDDLIPYYSAITDENGYISAEPENPKAELFDCYWVLYDDYGDIIDTFNVETAYDQNCEFFAYFVSSKNPDDDEGFGGNDGDSSSSIDSDEGNEGDGDGDDDSSSSIDSDEGNEGDGDGDDDSSSSAGGTEGGDNDEGGDNTSEGTGGSEGDDDGNGGAGTGGNGSTEGDDNTGGDGGDDDDGGNGGNGEPGGDSGEDSGSDSGEGNVGVGEFTYNEAGYLEVNPDMPDYEIKEDFYEGRDESKFYISFYIKAQEDGDFTPPSGSCYYLTGGYLPNGPYDMDCDGYNDATGDPVRVSPYTDYCHSTDIVIDSSADTLYILIQDFDGECVIQDCLDGHTEYYMVIDNDLAMVTDGSGNFFVIGGRSSGGYFKAFDLYKRIYSGMVFELMPLDDYEFIP